MISKTLTLLFAVGLTCTQASKWVLSWSDEFNGGNIDQSKWTFEQGAGGWGNNELEYYTNRKENAYLSGGNLIIQANKENYGGAGYTSARMITKDKFFTTYGKIESRAKIPIG